MEDEDISERMHFESIITKYYVSKIDNHKAKILGDAILESLESADYCTEIQITKNHKMTIRIVSMPGNISQIHHYYE